MEGFFNLENTKPSLEHKNSFFRQLFGRPGTYSVSGFQDRHVIIWYYTGLHVRAVTGTPDPVSRGQLLRFYEIHHI